MNVMTSQSTCVSMVYSTVCSGTDQRKHQSSFMRGIHRWPGNSPHKGPVTRKMLPFDDVIMEKVQPHIFKHYTDVIMTTMASQITSLTVVYSTVYSDADQRKHQSSASLAFVWGIHRDRWIPRAKGQLRGNCFHLMTSSWSWRPVWSPCTGRGLSHRYP